MKGCVAVTGATGFIGRHLINTLKDAGFGLRALSRRVADHGLPPEVEVISGSLEDDAGLSRLLEPADAVVHCAGLIKGEDSQILERVNVTGTIRLARLCAQQPKPPRFVFLSSLAARHPELSVYAATKHRAEAQLAELGGGLPWTILRPPAVYGPGDRETLQFFRFMQGGYFPIPKLEHARVSLIYVSDLCAAVAALLTSPQAEGETHDVRDPCAEGYSWRAVAAAGGRSLGRKVTCIPVPRPVMNGIARAGQVIGRFTGRSPPLTPGKVRELYHADWVCRENPVSQLTGWQPKIGLEEGMDLTYRWYRDNGWL